MSGRCGVVVVLLAALAPASYGAEVLLTINDFSSGTYNGTADPAQEYGATAGELRLSVPYAAKDPDLISYWRLEGNASDETGKNAATLIGGTYTPAGKFGSSAALDGIDDYLSVGSQPVGELIGDTFTVSFWVNPGAVADRPTFGFADSGSNFAQNPIASTDMGLFVGNNYQLQIAPRLPDAPVGMWTHYAIVDDDANYVVYVNGVETSATAIVVNPDSPYDRSFVIGQTGYVGPLAQSFNGSIDEFQVFDRDLSQEEIDTRYNSGKEHVPSGDWTSQPLDLVEWYLHLDKTTIHHPNVDADSYISRVQWLVGDEVVAEFDTPIVSGTSTTITEDMLTSGSFQDVTGVFKIKVFLQGNSTPTISEIDLRAIPEPASLSLLILGGLVVLARRRRRRPS